MLLRQHSGQASGYTLAKGSNGIQFKVSARSGGHGVAVRSWPRSLAAAPTELLLRAHTWDSGHRLQRRLMVTPIHVAMLEPTEAPPCGVGNTLILALISSEAVKYAMTHYD
jgi:hypothetical protein